MATTPSSSSMSSSPSTRASVRGGAFSLLILEDRPGILVAHVDGPKAPETFANEAGGHRWQRVPPNDKRGRVQTSTVTVAVLQEPEESELDLPLSDLDISTCRGSGAGGQHRNKTDSAVIIVHRPTGVTVRCESERSQYHNKKTALALLRARLQERLESEATRSRDGNRRQQVGSGMRGDKRRTIRCQDGQVNDHVTGRTWRLKDYLRGEW